MTKLGDARKHYWLMKGMARARGVDLGRAMTEGRLSTTGYAGMVTACRSCSRPGACKALTNTHEALETGPAYCVNRDRLTDLRD
ncbi:DUF6455 family protein [Salibaculum halophilum]|uniref:DUF6455 family protein n=1 Tax=Salibaculum halophilum TaxID=1914408 RepID=UPI000A11B586|nr:DUF6455 family protein [Salibaculum halophilum]